MPILNPNAIDNPYYSLGEMYKLSTGIMGHLVEEGKNGVCIPTLYSYKEGKGNVGRYIEGLKQKYSVIKFPSILNPVFEGMLRRRGFKVKREYVPVLKGHADVYIWRKG